MELKMVSRGTLVLKLQNKGPATFPIITPPSADCTLFRSTYYRKYLCTLLLRLWKSEDYTHTGLPKI